MIKPKTILIPPIVKPDKEFKDKDKGISSEQLGIDDSNSTTIKSGIYKNHILTSDPDVIDRLFFTIVIPSTKKVEINDAELVEVVLDKDHVRFPEFIINQVYPLIGTGDTSDKLELAYKLIYEYDIQILFGSVGDTLDRPNGTYINFKRSDSSITLSAISDAWNKDILEILNETYYMGEYSVENTDGLLKNYNDLMKERKEVVLKNYKQQSTTLEQSIKNLQKDLTNKSIKKHNIDMILMGCNSLLISKDKLRLHPNITHIRFDKSNMKIIVHTDHIKFEHRGYVIDVGKMKIEISLKESSSNVGFKYTNLNNEHEENSIGFGSHGIHIDIDGIPCLGGWATIFASFLERGDIENVINNAVGFLFSINENDAAGIEWVRWTEDYIAICPSCKEIFEEHDEDFHEGYCSNCGKDLIIGDE